MSKLRTSNGDDHPEAAHKHLLDAQALISQQRPDGAAYLSGYVVECALKSLLLLESGTLNGNAFRGRNGHNLNSLTAQATALATVAGSKTARYLKAATCGIPLSAIAMWMPEMRYQPATMTPGNALVWLQIADAVYNETVAQMRLDGVL